MSHMREIQFRTKLTFKTKSRLSKHEKLLDCIRSYFLYNSIQSSNELSEYSQRKRKAKFLGYSMYCTSIIMEYNTVWISRCVIHGRVLCTDARWSTGLEGHAVLPAPERGSYSASIL